MNPVVQFMLAGPKVGPDVGKASPVGLFIVVILLIFVFFLVWSMNRHLRKVPKSFDPQPPAVEDAAAKTPVSESPATESPVNETPTDTEASPHESGG